MVEFLADLKRRKLVQWALAYVAGAWAVLQALGLAADSYDWPHRVMQIAFAATAVGFAIALVLAWFHGERGAQRVSGAELLLIALVLAIGGGLLWRISRVAPSAPGTAVRGTHGAQGDRRTSAPDTKAAQSALRAAFPPAQTVPIPAKSIAVLPFVNMSGDARNDYFSDGITEEILNALAQVPKLKVAARTSAFAFKGKEEDLRKVGEVLDVATVLEGSVQRSGDEVRITAQLIDTRTGYHLWSEKYDRKLTSIFAVEDEISKAIADKLRVQLVGGDNRALVAQTRIDPRAHDLYLRGLTLLAGRRHLRDAVGDFRQALDIAPRYAQAWAKLAQADMLLPWYEHDNVKTAVADARGAVEHALALEPDNASAWAARGMIDHMGWRWASADKAFRRALHLAPGDAEVINQYAQFMSSAGQFDAALSEFRKAQALDPLSPAIAPGLIQNLLAMHRYAEAEREARAALATYPDTSLSYSAAMKVAIYRKRYAEAEAYARRDLVLAGSDAGVAKVIAKGVSDPAQRAAAARAIESYAARARDADHAATGEWLAALGSNESALASLERFAARGAGVNEGVVWMPAFDPVRNDPRFRAILKKMGLPYRPPEVGSP
ncbi:MAG TPA: tetratricopeptide repeat protein [Rhodanobacteraceae bacterium]